MIKKLVNSTENNRELSCGDFDRGDFREFWLKMETLEESLGIHHLDLLRFLMGEITEVAHRKYQRDDTHTSYALLLTFASGAIGTLFVSDQHLWMRTNERVEITGNGQFVVAENLIHLTHYRSDGEASVPWEPGFSIPNDQNLSFFIGGYAGELQAFVRAIREGQPLHASISDACAALRIIKQIEPDETYVAGPATFPHWLSENYWLGVDA